MIRIPAQQVANGHMPHVCPRHGEPAIEMKRMKLISKPAPWTPVLILLAVIVYLIVVMAMRKTVVAPTWPWCARCKAARARTVYIGLGVFAAGILLFIVGVALANNDNGAGGLLFFVGFVCFIVGLVFLARSGGQAVAGAFVSQDGNFVEVPKSDPRGEQALAGGRQPQQQQYPPQYR